MAKREDLASVAIETGYLASSRGSASPKREKRQAEATMNRNP